MSPVSNVLKERQYNDMCPIHSTKDIPLTCTKGDNFQIRINCDCWKGDNFQIRMNFNVKFIILLSSFENDIWDSNFA